MMIPFIFDLIRCYYRLYNHLSLLWEKIGFDSRFVSRLLFIHFFIVNDNETSDLVLNKNFIHFSIHQFNDDHFKADLKLFHMNLMVMMMMWFLFSFIRYPCRKKSIFFITYTSLFCVLFCDFWKNPVISDWLTFWQQIR